MVQRHAVAVEYACGDLALFAGNIGDVGGQAVQIQRLAVLGQRHHFLGALPILVGGILSEQFLFELLDAVKVAVAVELGALFHRGVGRPALGIDDIRVFERFFHIVGLSKTAAGLCGIGFGNLFDLCHHVVALGMRQHYVHAEAGEQSDHALRNGEGLAVAR